MTGNRRLRLPFAASKVGSKKWPHRAEGHPASRKVKKLDETSWRISFPQEVERVEADLPKVALPGDRPFEGIPRGQSLDEAQPFHLGRPPGSGSRLGLPLAVLRTVAWP
jgi:hypothetical protein